MEDYFTIDYPEYDPHARVRYYGQVRKGLFHGFGTLTWNNGAIYKGHWVDDIRQGYGVFTYPESCIVHQYRGQWVGGKKHGRGFLM